MLKADIGIFTQINFRLLYCVVKFVRGCMHHEEVMQSLLENAFDQALKFICNSALSFIQGVETNDPHFSAQIVNQLNEKQYTEIEISMKL